MRISAILFLIAAHAFACLSALGVNCQGSWLCDGFVIGLDGDLQAMEALANELNSTHIYQNGEYIACVKAAWGPSLCTFPQHTPNGLAGDQIKPLLQSLIQHGCEKCGSVPIHFPTSNDPWGGILTVNAVSSTRGCNDVC